jgi:hypothetical protein
VMLRTERRQMKTQRHRRERASETRRMVTGGQMQAMVMDCARWDSRMTAWHQEMRHLVMRMKMTRVR